MSVFVKELKCKAVMSRVTNSSIPFIFKQFGSKNGNFSFVLTTSSRNILELVLQASLAESAFLSFIKSRYASSGGRKTMKKKTTN